MQGKIGHRATHTGLVVGLAVSLTSAAAPAVRVAPAPKLLDLRVSNSSTPYTGDGPLLTTVSPNGDGFRDRAVVGFRLTKSATVELDVLQTVNVKRGKNTVQTISSVRHAFSRGRHRLGWAPARSLPGGSDVLQVALAGAPGRAPTYNDLPLAGRVRVRRPVARRPT